MCTRRKGALLLVLGGFTLGVGCQEGTSRGASGRSPERIVVAAEPVPHAAPLWIAEAKAYFADEGLVVEIREFPSGRTALGAMLRSDEIDIATAAQTPVVAHSFERDDYAIVAGMAHSGSDVQVLARRDRGVGSVSDLRGKRIGVTSGSSGHFFLTLLLAYQQLRLADVTLIDMDAPQLADAVIRGDTDAIASWEPHISRAASALGANAALLPSAGVYREDFYFIARKRLLDHPGTLVRFLRAVDRAAQLSTTRGDEARSLVARRLGMSPELLERLWSRFAFGLFLDQSALVSLEDEARWAVAASIVPAARPPNYLQFLYPAALEAVRPSAVTLIGR